MCLRRLRTRTSMILEMHGRRDMGLWAVGCGVTGFWDGDDRSYIPRLRQLSSRKGLVEESEHESVGLAGSVPEHRVGDTVVARGPVFRPSQSQEEFLFCEGSVSGAVFVNGLVDDAFSTFLFPS